MADITVDLKLLQGSISSASNEIDTFLNKYNNKKITIEVETKGLQEIEAKLKQLGLVNPVNTSANGSGKTPTPTPPKVDSGGKDDKANSVVKTDIDAEEIQKQIDNADLQVNLTPNIDPAKMDQATNSAKKLGEKVGDAMQEGAEKKISFEPFAKEYEQLQKVLNNPNVSKSSDRFGEMHENAEAYLRVLEKANKLYKENPGLSAERYFKNNDGSFMPEEQLASLLANSREYRAVMNANLQAQKPIIDQQNELRKAMDDSVKAAGARIQDTQAYKDLAKEWEVLEQARQSVAEGRLSDGYANPAQAAIDSVRDLNKDFEQSKAIRNLKDLTAEYKNHTSSGITKELKQMEDFWAKNPILHGTDEGKEFEKRLVSMRKLNEEASKIGKNGGPENLTQALERTNDWVRYKDKSSSSKTLNEDTLFSDNGEVMVAAENRLRSLGNVTEITSDKIRKSLANVKDDLKGNANLLNTSDYKALERYEGQLERLVRADNAGNNGKAVDLYKKIARDNAKAIKEGRNEDVIPIDLLDKIERHRTGLSATGKSTGRGGTTTPNDLLKQADILDAYRAKNQMAAGTSEYKAMANLSQSLREQADRFQRIQSSGNFTYPDYQNMLARKGWRGQDLTNATAKAIDDMEKLFVSNPEYKGNVTVDKLTSFRNKLSKQIEPYANAEFANQGQRDAYNSAQSSIKVIDDALKSANGNSSKLAESFTGAGTSIVKSMQNARESTSAFAQSVEGELVKGTKDYNTQFDATQKLLNGVTRNLDNWKVAQTGNSKDSYAGLVNVQDSARDLLKELDMGGASKKDIISRIDTLKNRASDYAISIKDAGENINLDTYRKNVENLASTMSNFYKNNPAIHGTDAGNFLNTASSDMNAVIKHIDEASKRGLSLGDAFSSVNKELNETYSHANLFPRMTGYLKDAEAQADALGNTGVLSVERLNNVLNKSDDLLKSNLWTDDAKKSMQNYVNTARDVLNYGINNHGADLHEYANKQGYDIQFLDKLANENVKVGNSLKNVNFKEAYDLDYITKMRDSLDKTLGSNLSLMGEDFYQGATLWRDQLDKILNFADTNAPGTTAFKNYIDGLDKAGVSAKDLQKTVYDLNQGIDNSAYRGNGVSPEDIAKASVDARKLLTSNQNAVGTDWYNNLKKFADETEMVGNVWKNVSRGAAEYQQLMRGYGWSGEQFNNLKSNLFSTFNDQNALNGLGGTMSDKTVSDMVRSLKKTRDQFSNVELWKQADQENLERIGAALNAYESYSDFAKKHNMPLSEAYATGKYGDTSNLARSLNEAQKAQKDLIASTDNQLLRGTSAFLKKNYVSSTLQDEIDKSLNKWTKAAGGRSKNEYAQLANLSLENQALHQELNNGKMSETDYSDRIGKIKAQYEDLSGVIKANGEDTLSFSDKLGAAVGKFSEWYMASQLAMLGIRKIKEAVGNVVDMDTAMTELKKVTNETGATYEKFYVNAGKRAQQYGATVTDVISATADYARLGLSLDEATSASDAAIVYKNVGDGLKDINEASESIVSTMQAFNVPAKEAMTIVDKFNEVGNNYSISSSGLGQSLLRSAAAMSAAGNTLDQTIAMATAANEIVQNPEKVGEYVPKRTVRCGVAFAT